MQDAGDSAPFGGFFDEVERDMRQHAGALFRLLSEDWSPWMALVRMR
jgi:hypothetical protein